MVYTELEDTLLYFDHMESEYGKIKNKTNLTEYDTEQLGFISGEIHETAEILKCYLIDSNYFLVLKFLEDHCVNSFSTMMSNLHSNSDKYDTLYDLLKEVNIKREDKI